MNAHHLSTSANESIPEPGVLLIPLGKGALDLDVDSWFGKNTRKPSLEPSQNKDQAFDQVPRQSSIPLGYYPRTSSSGTNHKYPYVSSGLSRVANMQVVSFPIHNDSTLTTTSS